MRILLSSFRAPLLTVTLSILCLVPTLGAEAQSGPGWFFNVDGDNVAVDGYDVVAYFVSGDPTPGAAEFEVDNEGIRYRFASAENRDAFVADPHRYLPICGGWDAFFCGVDPDAAGFAATRWKPTPESFRIVDGRLLLLSDRPAGNSVAAFAAAPEPAAIIERADAFWADRLARGRSIGERPEGMHPQARMELADWRPLLGAWRCEGFVRARGPGEQYVSIGTATWTFAYGFDGMLIEDFWMPDVNAAASGPALRGYDATNDVWKMTFFTASGPGPQDWQMTGRWIDGELQADLSINDGQVLGKVRFYDIDAESFHWRSSRSFDAGATWIEDFQYTDCARPAASGAVGIQDSSPAAARSGGEGGR